MTPLEEFEAILKDVVNAKRLSASKITSLTDLAMKNMAHDIQLVSTLYRNHKSLPAASKISSLYVFDALARAARHQVVKHNITGDAYTQPGNCATFLLKIEGVLEGLFQDMLTSGNDASKEKTKKIYDIWVKGNTFPSNVLSQLGAILDGKTKEVDTKMSVTTDPRLQNHTPVTQSTAPAAGTPPSVPSQTTPPTAVVQPSPTPTALDPQAALLALLTQAAATSVTHAASFTTGTSTGPLDATQLAVLQQLAHTAASVPSVTQSLPSATAVNVQTFPSSPAISGSSRSPLSIPNGLNNVAKFDKRLESRYRSPDNELGRASYCDERDNVNGNIRGGFRSNGRGDRFGRRWGERDRFRDSERERSPTRRRSRSRSPPSRNNGDRRPIRHLSSPRRLSVSSGNSWSPSNPTKTGPDVQKDEFGREIRSSSRSPTPAHEKSPATSLPLPLPRDTNSQLPTTESHSSTQTTIRNNNHTIQSVPPTQNSTVSAKLSQIPVSITSDTSMPGLGLDSFNSAAFDVTSPASWEALGKMWEVTNSTSPTQEQLMQFIMLQTFVGMQNTGTGHQPAANLSTRGRGRGGFTRGAGRGTFYSNDRMSGHGYEGQEYGTANMQDTDAIVLGGDTDAPQQSPVSADAQMMSPLLPGATPSSVGRMKRVGDKWVFVRGTPMDVS